VDFQATSADDTFFITAQGLDFDDENWTFHLHGPGGLMLYGDGSGRHHDECQHCCPRPVVTAGRGKGRLSLLLQRGNASAECWVGRWRLMVAYKASRPDAMVMPEVGEWLFPISAGPARGARYARLLQRPAQRQAVRNVARRPLHALDVMPASTNRSDREACDMVVNIYARTGLQIGLLTETRLATAGSELKFELSSSAPKGRVVLSRAFARLVAPTVDLADVVAQAARGRIPVEAKLEGSEALKFDPAKLLAVLERRNRKLAVLRDQQATFVTHHDGPPHVHEKETDTPGVYHLGVYVEGVYYPTWSGGPAPHPHHGGAFGPEPGWDRGATGEHFTRLLTLAVAVARPTGRGAPGSKKPTRPSKGKPGRK
jgi:hypothetical protein